MYKHSKSFKSSLCLRCFIFEIDENISTTNCKVCSLSVQVTIEEFTMESERSKGKVLITKLIIQQRMSDDTYLGELHTDRDYIQGYPLKGTMCK